MSDETKDMAAKHVDWWLSSVRQLLIDNFVHGARERVVKAAKRLCRMGPEHSGFLTMYYELDNAVAWLNKLEKAK